MAITNYERIGKALELLRDGLAPFVERELNEALKKGIIPRNLSKYTEDPLLDNKPISEWDVSALLKIMWDTWNEVFK